MEQTAPKDSKAIDLPMSEKLQNNISEGENENNNTITSGYATPRGFQDDIFLLINTLGNAVFEKAYATFKYNTFSKM